MGRILNLIYKDWYKGTHLPNGLTRFEVSKINELLSKTKTDKSEVDMLIDLGLRPNCKIGPFLSTDLLKEFKTNFVRLEDVKDGEVYLYVIELLHQTGLYRSLPQIPDEIIDLVNQDRCFVIYDYEHEGQFDYNFFNQWYQHCVKQEGYSHIKYNNFYVLTGDLNYDRQLGDDVEINFVPSLHFVELCGTEAVDMIEGVSSKPNFKVRSVDEIDVSKKTKHFLSYNRNCQKDHRKSLGAYFEHNNLWKSNHISFLKGSWTNDTIPGMLPDDYLESCKRLDKMDIIELDTKHLKDKFGFGTSFTDMWEFYQETFLSVVSETLFDESVFLSEKICKPILSLHPFIIVGSPRTLQKLHQLGFKTFEPFISEKYDDVINQKERLELVFKELDKFRNKPIEELQEWFKSIEPTLKHNQEVLLKMGKEKSSKVKFLEKLYD
jgi:hypothetical protein